MVNQAVSDPSRYVLADDVPYLRNLAALWTVDPALAAAIESLHPTPGYDLKPSKSGAPTVSVLGPSGADVLLHSRYRPIVTGNRHGSPETGMEDTHNGIL